MMSLDELSTWPENAAPVRDLRWFEMPARMAPRPYCTSSGEVAKTNWPRAFTVACQRSSTATAPLLPAGSGGLFGLVRSGHCTVPATMLASVAVWFSASSVPEAPKEMAENWTCCHQAISLVGSMSLGALPDHAGTSSF